MGIQITPTPLQIHANTVDTKRTVTAYGDPVYYGPSKTVSSTSFTGTLTSGQALLITSPTWFVTAPDIGRRIPGSARLEIAEHDELDERIIALETSVSGLVGGGGGTTSLPDAAIFNLRDYGGLGDGTGALLSSAYANLAAAQVVFPAATALTQSIDDAAFFSAVAAAEANSTQTRCVTVHIPTGLWRSTEEWVAGDNVIITGDGWDSSVLQPITDFGKGRFALRWTGFKVNRVHIRGLGLSGPFRSSPAMGGTACKMNGLQIPGGGVIADEIKAEYFYIGAEMCSDHSSITNSVLNTNYYNLYMGSDTNAEADQFISGCDFANPSFASIGIKGSNIFGGITMVSTHLGFGPYGFYKESHLAAGTVPTATPGAGGSTGAPFTAGGTFYYLIAPLFGTFTENMVGTPSSATVVPAGGHVDLSWAAVTDATGYRIYRSTVASPNTTLSYFDVGAVTSVTDTGPLTLTRFPNYGNSLAVSGCTLIDCPGESFGNGYLMCEDGTASLVNNNIIISAATANAFDVNKKIVAAQRAAVTCGVFSNNRFVGDCASWFSIGPDSDGQSVLAVSGTGNWYECKDTTWMSNTKPFSTVGIGMSVRDMSGGREGFLTSVTSGSVVVNDPIVANLSNNRMKASAAGDTSPCTGVAAQSQATTNGFFFLWTKGQVDISSSDAAFTGHNQYVKFDPVNAAKVVKGNGRWDGPAIGMTISGLASGKVRVELFAPGSGGGIFAVGLKAITATVTLTHQDDVVTVDTTAGNVVVNVPTAVGFTGRKFIVKRITAGANTLTIDPSGAQTIDGAATLALAAQWDKAEFVSDGANWLTV